MYKLAVVIAALISLNLVGCGQRPRIDVLVTIEDGHVVFDLPHSGMNYINNVKVLGDDGKPLWHIHVGGQKWQGKSLKITYGVLPPAETDSNSAPHQFFPRENQPPRDIRGKTVQVEVYYQYDSPAPSMATFRKSVEIP